MKTAGFNVEGCPHCKKTLDTYFLGYLKGFLYQCKTCGGTYTLDTPPVYKAEEE